MFENFAKWIAGIAGLCLLCCAAPLALAFLGGGGVAAASLWSGPNWFGMAELGKEISLLLGVAVMAVAAWLILRRRRLSGPACDVK